MVWPVWAMPDAANALANALTCAADALRVTASIGSWPDATVMPALWAAAVILAWSVLVRVSLAAPLPSIWTLP